MPTPEPCTDPPTYLADVSLAELFELYVKLSDQLQDGLMSEKSHTAMVVLYPDFESRLSQLAELIRGKILSAQITELGMQGLGRTIEEISRLPIPDLG
ncbi:MAG: hypothetical protein Q7S80_02390 [bacterium]|nr:hypothetical protein [bacterium]